MQLAFALTIHARRCILHRHGKNQNVGSLHYICHSCGLVPGDMRRAPVVLHELR
jgi:hypothetical protein